MPESKVVKKIEILSLRGDQLEIGGYAYIDGIDNRGALKQLQFVDQSRDLVLQVALETEVRADLSDKYPENDHDYSDAGFTTTTVSLSEVLPDGNYKLSILVQVADTQLVSPVNVTSRFDMARTKPSTTRTHSIVPYAKSNKLFIRIHKDNILRRVRTTLKRVSIDMKREARVLFVKRQWKTFAIMQLYRLTQSYLRRKHIWLVGERRDTAQDNGYHLFKYIRDNHLVANCYYAIDKKSPDYALIADLGHIIQHGSIRHVLYLLCCEKLINTQIANRSMFTSDYLRVVSYHPEWQNSRRYFLQHGVTGFSRIGIAHVKNAAKLTLWATSSETERNFIATEFGYEMKDVEVTGLARWDQLIDTSGGRTILLMPTWRRWIDSSSQMVKSELYKRIISLLSNPKLHALLDEYQLKLIFSPHYNMQPYLSNFPEFHPRIENISQREVTIQSLICSCDMLLTDYSSVSFDVSYMKKPVVFYQFDADTFYSEHYQLGYITQDMLFGELATNEDQVLECLRRFAISDPQFMSCSVENPFIVRYPGHHRQLNYEAILGR